MISLSCFFAVSYENIENIYEIDIEQNNNVYLSNIDASPPQSIFENIFEYFQAMPNIILTAANPQTILGGNVFLCALPFFNIPYSFSFPFPISTILLLWSVISTVIITIFSLMIVLSFIPTISG